MYLNRNSICDNIILLTKSPKNICHWHNLFQSSCLFFKKIACLFNIKNAIAIKFESLLFYTLFILLSREFDGTSYLLILLLYHWIFCKRNMHQTSIIEKVRISNKLLLKARNIALRYNSLDCIILWDGVPSSYA